jgi:DNA polymerase-4
MRLVSIFPERSGYTANRPPRAWPIFVRRAETSLGITVSVGLSANTFLAKVASDLDKPRGFLVLGRTEAAGFLVSRPVTTIFGVGRATRARLARGDYRTLADLQHADLGDPVRRYGSEGERPWQRAQGSDARPVRPQREPTSVSAETTFDRDIANPNVLEQRLWLGCERVSARLKVQE